MYSFSVTLHRVGLQSKSMKGITWHEPLISASGIDYSIRFLKKVQVVAGKGLFFFFFRFFVHKAFLSSSEVAKSARTGRCSTRCFSAQYISISASRKNAFSALSSSPSSFLCFFFVLAIIIQCYKGCVSIRPYMLL